MGFGLAIANMTVFKAMKSQKHVLEHPKDGVVFSLCTKKTPEKYYPNYNPSPEEKSF